MFDTSIMKESLKNKVTMKEEQIKELKIKLNDKQEVKHLGRQSEIQDLKSQIHAFQNKPIALALPILDISDLRDLKVELHQVKDDLRHATDTIQEK